MNHQFRYSGITAEKMNGISTTLKDVQQHLKQLIFADTVLVGHSLENDLHALKVYTCHYVSCFRYVILK